MIKTRLQIIELLRQKPHSIRDLVEVLGANSRQCVAYHLYNLTGRGLAQCRLEVQERERKHDGALLAPKVKVFWIG